MKETKKYWKGLEQLQKTPAFEKYANKEFAQQLPLGDSQGETSRRDFLKVMGFGVAAVSLAACETPIKKAIPYVKKPISVDPGIANYYASTFVSGSDQASVIVKTREGRPIKIEGNKLSSVSGGGTNAQIESSVLSLYDQERLTGPTIDGTAVTWGDIDVKIKKTLSSATEKIYLVSNTISSPSTKMAIEAFQTKYPNVQHVCYDQVSVSGSLDANMIVFGKRVLPNYDYSKAKTIVSFESDFLGTGVNNTANNRQFARTRKLSETKKEMSRLYSFESILSLTGANADYRAPIKPSEQGLYVANLYNLIAKGTGGETIQVAAIDNDYLNKAAHDLLNSKGGSIVISGSNDANIQLLINAINVLLENYSSTIDIVNHQNLRAGDDKLFASFVTGLSRASGVIFYNCNPIYDHPLGTQIAEAMKQLTFTVSTSDRNDETSALVSIKAPDHHYLESWNDFEAVNGKFSLCQPAISKIFDTRQVQDGLLIWAESNVNYYDFLRANWTLNQYNNSGAFADFNSFWEKSLQDGVYELPDTSDEISIDLSGVAAAVASLPSPSSELELVIYQNGTVGNGIQANNPWLQEMSDPITKACWDNYLTVSPKQVAEWGIELGDMTTQKIDLTVNGQVISLPVLPQPGQKYNTVGLALGYGRTNAGKVGNNVGVNAYPLIAIDKLGSLAYNVSYSVQVTPTNEEYSIAQTQTHHTFMGRGSVIQETTLSEYQKDPQAGRHMPKIATSEGFKKPTAVSLWKGHQYANHHWGLIVDLNSCTGCGTCSISCQTENNISVIGKKEVLNRRDMAWIRIDRYYSSDSNGDSYADMEIAAENPEVTFQPMMCQHCNNASCETVCPVAATTHSSEGLNQMTYNRCIGTRYCANNCPYKVRRFNWFKFHDNEQFSDNLAMNNDLGKMVLNPDVTVRSRGVIEKCSFCVQRIQSGKLEAKKEGRRPIDGEITTACASSCPSEALVFGDMKDPSSKISKMLQIKSMDKGVEAQEPRAYHVLEELREMPNVWYLTKVRNKDEKKEASNAHS
ncbi:MAG: TAT-variant-translocated molybdopterin oxidoreductase [Flammeovirgaceae bacterium]|jgi:MoCo/4Fe-4S cofactor protein with predicted Tat translocation signal|nr:TAT-variant-translocated molybdopterin oxidoreductase [Flammeovirgaceae bacterium]|tara:strand:- start:10265 stop:13345 length:3081 start_codon:yes stop_codon:yes gene_type:complete